MSMHVAGSAGVSTLAHDEFPHGKPYAFYVLFLMFSLFCLDFVDRVIVSSLFSDLNHELGITTTQFGALTAIVNVSVALLAFPSSLLIDRWSSKNMVCIMGLFWGISCLLCMFTSNFMQLFVLRFLVGMGEAGYGPGSSTIVQTVFPPNKCNSALGILQSASPIGVVLGMVIGGVVTMHLGWRHAFGVVAIPGLIIAVLIFFLKEPVRVAVTKVNKDTGKEESVPLGQILKKIFRTKTLVLVYLAMAMALIFNACITIWIPSYFRYSEGLNQQEAGFKSAGIMLAGALGAILCGMIADRVGKKNESRPVLLCGVYVFLAGIFYLLAFNIVPENIKYYFMLVGSFFLNGILGSAFNAVLSASHPGIRATALGCLVVVQNILGMAVGAGVSGLLATYYQKLFQATSSYADILAQKGAEVAQSSMLEYGIKYSIVTMCFTTFISSILFITASRFFRADCKGAECFE